MGFRENKRVSAWRRVALGAWGAPRDPTAYGTLEIDCEAALAYVEAARAASGEKVTLTHLVGRAVGLAMAERPEVNAFASRGRLMQRDSVDVFFQVSFADRDADAEAGSGSGGTASGRGANLAGAKVRAIDTKSVPEIARELRERAEAIRARGDAETAQTARTMARLPPALVGMVTRAGAFLSYDLGVDLSRLGVPNDAFGSCMVTNVGVFGIEVGYAPLFSLARVPLILTVGAVRQVPVAKDGAVTVRRRATIGVAFDHRVLDGFHAGALASRFRQVLEEPSLLEPGAARRPGPER